MEYKVVTRHSETDYFHDTYWEKPEKFVKRVVAEAEMLKNSAIQFCEHYAVISYENPTYMVVRLPERDNLIWKPDVVQDPNAYISGVSEDEAKAFLQGYIEYNIERTNLTSFEKAGFKFKRIEMEDATANKWEVVED